MAEIDLAATRHLEERFDPEIHFRPLVPPAAWVVTGLLVTLSIFHYYTAGFGLLAETMHRSVHMAFVLSLIFLVFPLYHSAHTDDADVVVSSWWRPGGVPLYDWLLGVLAAGCVLYLPYIYEDLAYRVGNPYTIDVIMGTGLIVLLLEATRRAMGWTLPLITLGFILYALFGRLAPGVLVHPGATWSGVVNHLYLTSQGIFGIAVGVVATYVFHFVLFGVLASRIGLGQLFIDIASCIAGRYSGGPAKVSIFSSALFGSISGSSIANAVTVGSLTIPAMVRLGYARHFAAAVEATASTGGQIMPPVMGAAAFLMVEFLNIPYQQIMLAALVPALLHFYGVFIQVHFEAKRLGLRGLDENELPKLKNILRRDWPSIAPLLVLIVILLEGYTPYMAAFWGITTCLVVGFINPRHRLTVGDVWDAFATGAKYALSVGAAAAVVGIIIGVVTLTGVGFKISYIITTAAASLSESITSILPFTLVTPPNLTLFLTLLLTAIVCIIMGCGIPTTATYLIMVTVVAPTLNLLGVQPIVAHFFVFYYGVLADITPPVALAAFAAAGIANANPFQTGNTAFRLAMAKVLVPFVFVYSPAMLIVVPGFTWSEFAITTGGCILGITCLGAAFGGYFLRPMWTSERWLAAAAAVLMIVPGITSTLIGAALVVPIILRHLIAHRAGIAVSPRNSER